MQYIVLIIIKDYYRKKIFKIADNHKKSYSSRVIQGDISPRVETCIPGKQSADFSISGNERERFSREKKFRSVSCSRCILGSFLPLLSPFPFFFLSRPSVFLRFFSFLSFILPASSPCVRYWHNNEPRWKLPRVKYHRKVYRSVLYPRSFPVNARVSRKVIFAGEWIVLAGIFNHRPSSFPFSTMDYGRRVTKGWKGGYSSSLRIIEMEIGSE